MLTIRMLGELEVEHDGERVVLPGGRRACALLAWLALNPGRHRRPRLAARFWPDVPDASLPPAQSDLYPWAGEEPTPADAPWLYVSGDVPDR